MAEKGINRVFYKPVAAVKYKQCDGKAHETVEINSRYAGNYKRRQYGRRCKDVVAAVGGGGFEGF